MVMVVIFANVKMNKHSARTSSGSGISDSDSGSDSNR